MSDKIAIQLEQGRVLMPTDKQSDRHTDQFIQASIAISLKRIADALHGDDQNSGMKHMLGDISDRICRS